jgi:hypothetical protein
MGGHRASWDGLRSSGSRGSLPSVLACSNTRGLEARVEPKFPGLDLSAVQVRFLLHLGQILDVHLADLFDLAARLRLAQTAALHHDGPKLRQARGVSRGYLSPPP